MPQNVNYPIPSNMGSGPQNPYRTPFSGRRFASDLVYGLGTSAILGPASSALTFAGSPGRSQTTDRWFGATNDRNLADYNSYMQDQMRSDPGNRGLASRIRALFSGSSNQSRGGSRPGYSGPSWVTPGNQSSTSPTAPYQPNWPGAGTWPSGGQQENPYYGQGQGPLRMPGANRAPAQGNRGATQGTTIATGRAAQDMYEGMRDAARAGVLDQALREARQRAEGILQ